MITYKFIDNGEIDLSFDFMRIGKKYEKSEIAVSKGFVPSGDIGVFASIGEAASFAHGRKFVMFESYGKNVKSGDIRAFSYNRPIRHFSSSRLMAKIGYIILKKFLRHNGEIDNSRINEAISNKWRYWRREINQGEYTKSIEWANDEFYSLSQKMNTSIFSKEYPNIQKRVEFLNTLIGLLSPDSMISFSTGIEWYKNSKNSKALERWLKLLFYQEYVKSQETFLSTAFPYNHNII